MNIATSADALARAAYNALRLCPKTGLWAFAWLVVTSSRVTIITTDSYALSYSHLPLERPKHLLTVDGVAFKVTHEDLTALEVRCREGKKEGVSLEFDMSKHEIWYRGEDDEKDLCMDDIFEDGIADDSWDEIKLSVFRDLLAERADDPQARKVLLSTKYLQKLSMVKKEKDQGAHLYFSGEDDTVLAKIGEHYQMLIEPIDPKRHQAALGEEATW
jgi:hypothetical protein